MSPRAAEFSRSASRHAAAEDQADRLQRRHVIDRGEGVVQRGAADPGLIRLPLRAMEPLSSPLPKDSNSRLQSRDEVMNVRHERLGDRRRQHR